MFDSSAGDHPLEHLEGVSAKHRPVSFRKGRYQGLTGDSPQNIHVIGIGYTNWLIPNAKTSSPSTVKSKTAPGTPDGLLRLGCEAHSMARNNRAIRLRNFAGSGFRSTNLCIA